MNIFGLIRRFFLSLYKTLVQPILEYGNLVWGPNYKEDIYKVENTQQKATRMVNSIRNFEYEEQLKVLKLQSLNYRIYRGDMIAVCNYTTWEKQYDFLNSNPYQRRHAC